MSAREELRGLVNVLSEEESEHFVSLVRDAVAGERFWETDIAIVYNEYVKGRYRPLGSPPASGNGMAPGDGTAALGTSVEPPSGSVSPAAAQFPADEGIFAPIPITKAIEAVERIELPAPGEVDVRLGEALARRRTRREFTSEPLTVGQLSTMLHNACGISGSMEAYGYSRIPLRTFPSSGGLQAPEVYISAQSVESVRSGIYYYDPIRHELALLREGAFGATLRSLALGQPWVESASVVFIISGSYERLRWKYGERGYRFMCIDAGLVAQNLHLVAEGLGLGACAIAGFADDAVERLLTIDGQDEMVLLLLCVGATDRAGKEGPGRVL